MRHAKVRAGLDHFARAFGACMVAEQARSTALLGPTPVAIHDDGDVEALAGSDLALLVHGAAPSSGNA